MKFIIIFFFLALQANLEGQSVKVILDAMVSMDQMVLGKSLAPDLTFTLDATDMGVAKTEGLAQLKSFLLANPIKSYKVIHEGVSRGKEGFMGIGGLVTDKAKFRIYITFKSSDNNKYMVSAVRMAKDLL